ncbi:MAG TPA: helix-turn-helix domain-containing protein, partial [Candidatus Thermoplasmatota archaeon]|nr:helix-turn-helix domain-containing protein [Candidatus Thermoplasmatota archaeon]
PLYTRIDPARVLANPNRARIHEMARASPGIAASDIVRATGCARVVVDHHLRMLVAHGHLVARRGRKRIAYFPGDRAPDTSSHARTDALTDATRRRVACAVLEEPGLSQQEIADRLGLRPRLVSHHLRRLQEASLVEGQGSMPRRYRSSPLLPAALGAAAPVPAPRETA